MTVAENAVVICVDSSDFMRNEDYIPSRWLAQLHAVTWLVQDLASENTCTVVGIKGGRPSVLGSTSGTTGMRATLNPPLSESPFSCGCTSRSPYRLLPTLQLAQLLLRGKRGGRVITFSGSPTDDNPQELEKMVDAYQESGILFDVVAFGDGDSEVWEKLNHCRLSICPSDGPSIEDTISLLRWDAHQEDPPSPSSSSSQHANLPLLRIPPPSRVCRRVVVDSTKVPANSVSLSLSLMLSLSLPSVSGSPARDRVVLMVSLPPQRNKILVEFRAGRCQIAGHEVRPLRKKGHLAVLQVQEHLLQFIWRDRVSNQIVLDVSVRKGEATFQRVPLHTTQARVYYLHIFDTNKKHFFWMQHTDPSQDHVYCSTIYDFLAGPPPPQQTFHTNHLDPADVQHLLSLYRHTSLPSPTSSPSSPSSSSSSSSLLPFDSSRKWITNPAWNPPSLTQRHTALTSDLPMPIPARRSVVKPVVPPVHVPTTAHMRAVCAGGSDPGVDLSSATLASPSATTASASSLPELGIGSAAVPPMTATPPSPLADQGSAPLEGAPPPPPQNDRQ